MTKKKKIFVIWSYWAWNIWDEAILEMIKKNLWKGFEIKEAIPHLPYSFVKIPFRTKTLKNLYQSDFVILWGWWLFTDSDSIKAIKIWWNCINWSKFFWKRIFLYANSVWPFKNEKSKQLAKKYLEKVDKITLRDDISLKEIDKMWLKWEVFSDPVFTFPINEKWALNSMNPKKIIAVSIRNTKEEFKHKKFNEFLEKKEKEWYQILLTSMTNDDSIIFEKYYENNSRIIFKPKDFNELLEVLSEIKICIWMRLHFLIASAVLWKKMLAISYSSKVQWIMDKIWIKCLKLDEKKFEIKNEDFKIPKNIDKEKELVKKMNDKVVAFE